ncbi:MAG: 50S ribosomal protein L31 [Candidatus Vogelbacteria bacterium]
MKTDIHPIYHETAAVACSCGASFTVGSTLPKLHIEICSTCHPFFSGQDKILDTAGRVEKFKKRRVKSTEIGATKKLKKPRVKSNTKTSHGMGDLSKQS